MLGPKLTRLTLLRLEVVGNVRSDGRPGWVDGVLYGDGL